MKIKLMYGVATAFILLFMGCSQPADIICGSLPPDVCAVIYTEKSPSMEGYQPKTYLLKQGELENFREHHRGFSRAIDYDRLKFREARNPMLNFEELGQVFNYSNGPSTEIFLFDDWAYENKNFIVLANDTLYAIPKPKDVGKSEYMNWQVSHEQLIIFSVGRPQGAPSEPEYTHFYITTLDLNSGSIKESIAPIHNKNNRQRADGQILFKNQELYYAVRNHLNDFFLIKYDLPSGKEFIIEAKGQLLNFFVSDDNQMLLVSNTEQGLCLEKYDYGTNSLVTSDTFSYPVDFKPDYSAINDFMYCYNDVILCVIRAAAGADERLKIAAFDFKSQEWTFLFTPNGIPRERRIADYKFMIEQHGNYFDLPPHVFNYSDLE